MFGFEAWKETKQPLLSHSALQHGSGWLLMLEGFSFASLHQPPHLASRQIVHLEKTKQDKQIKELTLQNPNTSQTNK